jgi:hypothetical protein
MSAYAAHHVREHAPHPVTSFFRRMLAALRREETAPETFPRSGAAATTLLADRNAPQEHADAMHATYARYADRRPVNGRNLGTLPRRDAGASLPRVEPLIDRGPGKPPWMTGSFATLPVYGERPQLDVDLAEAVYRLEVARDALREMS